jgi:glycosyltransferase involved in cell wall biosynthesis
MAHDTGLRDKVIFAGERHDIPNLLASMDVSVQVSSSESMSNVILESMAAGVPVVAYDVGGNPELVHDEETGLLVRQNDEPELLRALYRLLTEHELRTRLGRNAKRFVRANFHMNTISRRFEQLYADLLNEKHVKVPN